VCVSGGAGGLSGRAKALADHLMRLSMQHMHTFDARGLANCAWAFAKLKYVPDAGLPTMLATEVATRLRAGDDFAAQVCMCVHVCVCVCVKCSVFFCKPHCVRGANIFKVDCSLLSNGSNLFHLEVVGRLFLPFYLHTRLDPVAYVFVGPCNY